MARVKNGEGRRMEKNKKEIKRKDKKESIFSRIGKALSERSQNAKTATIVLFIMILLSVISGIFTFYLGEPAKEIYISESQMIKETRNIYDFEAGTEERTAQETRAKEASEFYGSIMDKYHSDSNVLIKNYAGIHSNFFKALIAIAVVFPFVSIAIMFIGNPINFIFAIANMVIVVPVRAMSYLYNSFRNEKKVSKRTSSKHQLQLEAAN